MFYYYSIIFKFLFNLIVFFFPVSNALWCYSIDNKKWTYFFGQTPYVATVVYTNYNDIGINKIQVVMVTYQ